MERCEYCKNFYTCDNMGVYEECIPNNFKYFEKDEEILQILNRTLGKEK